MRCVSRITVWNRGVRKAASYALCASSMVLLAACSNGVSRFDYPMYASGSADNTITTSSLAPIPAEPIYPGGVPSRGPGVERRDLPPPPQSRQYAAPAPQSQQYAAAQPRRVETIPIRPQPQYQTPQRAPQPYVPAPPPQVEYKAPSPVPAASASKTVRVQRGDTLYKIAKRHGVSINQIKSANKISGTQLILGQQLVIPGGAAPAPSKVTKTYTVRRGDSVAKIARAHNISIAQLQRSNRLSKRAVLQPGQRLKIPGQPAPASKTVASSPAPVRVASRNASVPIPATKTAEAKPVTAKVPIATPPKKVAARSKSLPAPEPMTGNQFRWPVRGRIVSGFGKTANGKHNDGINVAVPKGTAIKAAENGVVAYAGSELEPYGNLILIRHANNWVTAYAHNDKLLVKRGDTVRRGQVISKAGQTGNASQPQLHFELRKGSKPVNPLSYMANS